MCLVDLEKHMHLVKLSLPGSKEKHCNEALLLTCWGSYITKLNKLHTRHTLHQITHHRIILHVTSQQLRPSIFKKTVLYPDRENSVSVVFALNRTCFAEEITFTDRKYEIRMYNKHFRIHNTANGYTHYFNWDTEWGYFVNIVLYT